MRSITVVNRSASEEKDSWRIKKAVRVANGASAAGSSLRRGIRAPSTRIGITRIPRCKAGPYLLNDPIVRVVQATATHLVDGPDPLLANQARGRMKLKHADLVEALTGQFDDHHAELARMLLEQIDALSAQIDTLTTRIDTALAAIPVTGNPTGDPDPDNPGPGARRIGKNHRRRHPTPRRLPSTRRPAGDLAQSLPWTWSTSSTRSPEWGGTMRRPSSPRSGWT